MKKVFIVTILVLLSDQLLKFWVKTTMYLHQSIEITDWFEILFVENPGMAFGMLFGGDIGKILLTIFRIVVCVFLIRWLIKLTKQEAPSILIICLSLILGGALGNIIDSIFYGVLFSGSNGAIAEFLPLSGGYAPLFFGEVVDMFYFPFFEIYFPDWMPFISGKKFIFFNAVFNIADAAVSVGVALLLIFQKETFSYISYEKKETSKQ